MSLTPGTHLGPYEIVALLGAGGMGEVYRARDTRLGREVALKTLPPEVANDPSRRQRFETEARAVAALNHPNIVAVYDVGDGYIVSELVDGESLRGVKPGLRKTIDIGVQLANGLAAAHAAGITHRDLKPENILLTRDGRVKILDFGLAKMAPPQAAAAGETVTVQTDPGVVMGTVGYMSPEQVRGQAADHRSDIFSFGLILYELLAGQRAFTGETSAETMTAILKQDPPELPEKVPAGVRQVVGFCLEKEAANRFQSARDLALSLSALSQSSGSTAAVAVVAPRGRRGTLAAAAAFLLAIGAAAGFLLHRVPASTVWNGVLVGGPEIATMPRPSPDGHLLAFVAKDADEVMQVWVMKPESGNRVMLTHRRDRGYAMACSWSPDGSRIYFGRWDDQPSGVFSVPALGGEEQTILEGSGYPDALADGSLILTALNGQHQWQLQQYWPDTGKSRQLPLVTGSAFPAIKGFPDGRRALVAGNRLGSSDASVHLYVIDLESGALRQLPVEVSAVLYGTATAVTRDGKSAIYATGHGNQTTIHSVPVDGKGGDQILFNLPNLILSLDTGPEGSIYLDAEHRPMEVVRFSSDGGGVERMGVPNSASDYAAVLPDGRAVWTEFVAGRSRLMLGAFGKEAMPIANTAEEITGPLAAVGADSVAFLIGPEPHHTIAVASVSSGRIVRRIEFDKGGIIQLAASPDGKTLYASASGSIWTVRESGEIRRLRAGDYAAVDPDGASLVIESAEPPNVRLIRFPLDGSPEREIPLAGPFHPGFGLDGASLRNGRLVAPGSSAYWYWPPVLFDLATGKSTRIPLTYSNDFHHMFWTADGKIVANTFDWRSSIWKFAPEKAR